MIVSADTVQVGDTLVNGTLVKELEEDRGYLFAWGTKEGKRARIYLGSPWDYVTLKG